MNKPLLFAACAVAALPALAQSGVRAFTAATVDFSAVRGSVEIRVSGAGPIILRGPSVLRARLEGGVLHLALPPGTSQGTRQAASGAWINSARGPGARAVQNIGGQVEAAPAAVAVVEVPASTTLRARGFTGEARIRGPARAADIDVGAGEVHIENLAGGRLAISGAGSLRVGQASGLLELALAGAGEIAVESGRIDDLAATLDGAGDIEVAATAMAARLRNRGSGAIRVERVTGPLDHEMTGAGEITVLHRGSR